MHFITSCPLYLPFALFPKKSVLYWNNTVEFVSSMHIFVFGGSSDCIVTLDLTALSRCLLSTGIQTYHTAHIRSH